MSYDLLVFEKDQFPQKRDDFLNRYEQLVRWETTTDLSGTSPKLRAFFSRFSSHFPPMDGALALPDDLSIVGKFKRNLSRYRGKASTTFPSDFDEACLTDYTFTPDSIYMAFAWSVSEKALSEVLAAAIETDVGFFDVSATDGAILHDQAELHEFRGKNPPPQVSALSKSDIFKLLSDTGWTVLRDKDDGTRYATLTEGDRIIRVYPTISNSSRGTRIGWGDGVCSKRFAKAISIIGDRSEAYHTMVLQKEKRQTAEQLTLQDAKRGLGEVLEAAQQADLNGLLDDVLKLPTSAPGNAPLRLLAAMACRGKFIDLVEMRDKMKQGNRMGFVPYIQLEHLERALHAYQLVTENE